MSELDEVEQFDFTSGLGVGDDPGSSSGFGDLPPVDVTDHCLDPRKLGVLPNTAAGWRGRGLVCNPCGWVDRVNHSGKRVLVYGLVWTQIEGSPEVVAMCDKCWDAFQGPMLNLPDHVLRGVASCEVDPGWVTPDDVVAVRSVDHHSAPDPWRAPLVRTRRRLELPAWSGVHVLAEHPERDTVTVQVTVEIPRLALEQQA